MSLPKNNGSITTGGFVKIVFPNFNVELSCDNEVELQNCIEMLKKGLELHETERAKEILLRDVEEADRAKEKKSIMEALLDLQIKHPNTFTTQPMVDPGLIMDGDSIIKPYITCTGSIT